MHDQTGLFAVASFAPEIAGYPNGCHVCEVEIDPETGKAELVKYVVIDDVGIDRPHSKRAWELPGPLTMSWPVADPMPSENCVTTPAVVMRPTLDPFVVNQRLPSGPVVMPVART